MDIVLMLKALGAVLAFAGGIWIGLGLPGLNKDGRGGEAGGRHWTLDRTWMNRLMRSRLDRPRRFSTRRLIHPGQKRKAPKRESGARRMSAGGTRLDPETSQSTQGGD